MPDTSMLNSTNTDTVVNRASETIDEMIKNHVQYQKKDRG